MKPAAKLILVVLAFAGFVQAQGIAGTVLNGTLRKPAAGDEVLLLRFGQGLQQVARTNTNANGRYSFSSLPSGPYVVRVLHQGQVYDREPHPGAKSVNIEVFESSSNVKQISTALVLVGLKAVGDTLEVVELHVIENTSNPPYVSDSATGLEIPVPVGAELEWVRGMAAGERPASASPVRIGNSNSYRVPFPLRPGQTRLQIAYRMKYSGSTTISLRFPGPVPRLGVVVPDGLHFTTANGVGFQRVAERGAEVQMISGVAPGQTVTFRIAGKPAAATAAQEQIASETQPAQTPSPAKADVHRVGAPAIMPGIPTPTLASRHSAYLLTALLITIAVVIVWLRMVLPGLSVLRRFRRATYNTTRAGRMGDGNGSIRADRIHAGLIRKANS